MKETKKNIIIAVTGASGSVYANTLLRELVKQGNKFGSIAVVFTDNAKSINEYESDSGFSLEGIIREYDNNDFTAPFASGSCSYDTMIICPASMGVIGRIAHGFSNDLVTRAADVMLKEKRRLIIVPRETPYNLIHIRNMETLTLAGAIICPATPSFYSKPKTIDDLVMTVVGRIMSLAGIDSKIFKWGEND
jgi:4-hydroxy-3-polyprenylbenzoate decarboxylase